MNCEVTHSLNGLDWESNRRLYEAEYIRLFGSEAFANNSLESSPQRLKGGGYRNNEWVSRTSVEQNFRSEGGDDRS